MMNKNNNATQNRLTAAKLNTPLYIDIYGRCILNSLAENDSKSLYINFKPNKIRH